MTPSLLSYLKEIFTYFDLFPAVLVWGVLFIMIAVIWIVTDNYTLNKYIKMKFEV